MPSSFKLAIDIATSIDVLAIELELILTLDRYRDRSISGIDIAIDRYPESISISISILVSARRG